MATFRKRGDKWHAEISKKGIRTYGSFNTKAQAREWAAQKETEILSENNPRPKNNKLLKDAFVRYAKEVSPGKKTARFEKIKINAFLRSNLANIPLMKLNAIHLSEWRDQRLKEVQSATVNRELNIISSILTTCEREWHWLHHNHAKDIKRPPNPKHRDRRISDHEIECIINALGYDDNYPIETKSALVGLYFLIAIETAMRLGEICTLSKEDIFIDDRYIVLRDTKNGDTRHVPLSKRAMFLYKKRLETALEITSEQAGALFRKAYRRTDI